MEHTENEPVVIVRYEALDDHGHSTLIVHGDPEVVAEVMVAVTLLLGAAADSVELSEPGELVAGSEDEDELGAAA